MQLTNSEIKILKYINRHPNQTYTEIYKKFPEFCECYLRLKSSQFIKSTDPNETLRGNEYNDWNNPTIVRIDRSGKMYLESLKWFNWQFVVKELLCPAFVAFVTTLITLVLTGELKLW